MIPIMNIHPEFRFTNLQVYKSTLTRRNKRKKKETRIGTQKTHRRYEDTGNTM